MLIIGFVHDDTPSLGAASDTQPMINFGWRLSGAGQMLMPPSTTRVLPVMKVLCFPAR